MCQIREWASMVGYNDYVPECSNRGTVEVTEIAPSDIQSALAANRRDYGAETFRLCPECVEAYEIRPTNYDRLEYDANNRLQFSNPA